MMAPVTMLTQTAISGESLFVSCVYLYTKQPLAVQKNHFLYVGWHTHLPRFHGEQPYRARVES